MLKLLFSADLKMKRINTVSVNLLFNISAIWLKLEDTGKKKTTKEWNQLSTLCQLKMLCRASAGTPGGTKRAPCLRPWRGKRRLKLRSEETGNGSHALRPPMLRPPCALGRTGLDSVQKLLCPDPQTPHVPGTFSGFFLVVFFLLLFGRRKQLFVSECLKV